MSGLDRAPAAAGATSVLLALVAIARPRSLVRGAGLVADGDPSLPLVVRFAAARQLAVGLALLTRPVDVARAGALFLPVTAVDAAAVVAGRRAGTLSRRASVLSLAALAGNVAALAAARRRG